MRTKLTVLALLTPLALASPTFGLAGGSTGSGGGGGGGGGGFSSSGSGGYGGSGGSGSWDLTSTIIFLLIMGLVFGLPLIAGLFNKSRRQWYQNKILKRAKEVDAAAGAANLDDGYWDPNELRQRVREAFFPIQMSWEKRDVSESRPFVSDALFERHRLQLEGYEKQNRMNRIADLNLSTVQIIRIYNVTDDGQDRFVAYIACSARDWMEDTRTGAMINGNNTSATKFEQYWSFVRHPQYGWVLDEIQQGEEAEYHLTAPIVNQDEGPRIYEQQDGGTPPAPATP
jgi:hypothetical protein